MMSVFRPTVTRRRKDGSKYTEKAAVWWCRFRHPKTDTLICRSLKVRDRQAAGIIERDMVRRAAMETAGLVDPYEKHRKRPIGEHLDDWKRSLLAKGGTELHASQTHRRAQRVFDGCKVKTWSDIQASQIQEFIANELGVGAATRNAYRRCTKALGAWMCRDRRAADNPLAYLEAENARTDRRHDRRAFEVEELRRLIDVAPPDRAMLYRVAVGTDLRANELRTLTRDSFDLDADPPTVTVKAAYSKHRREDILPMRAELAEALRVYLSDRDGPALDVPKRQAAVLREDLAAARALWLGESRTAAEREEREASDFLGYIDRDGRYADFHALRHTFISALASGGIHPKIAQALARHSSIVLTMDVYSHMIATDQSDALRVLPSLGDERKAVENVA